MKSESKKSAKGMLELIMLFCGKLQIWACLAWFLKILQYLSLSEPVNE